MIEKWDHQKKIFEIKIPEDVCIINSQISAVILIIWRYTYMLLFLTSAIIKIWLKHSNFVEIANIDIIKIKIDEINACIIQNKFENIKLIFIIIMVYLRDGTLHNKFFLKITLTIQATLNIPAVCQ